MYGTVPAVKWFEIGLVSAASVSLNETECKLPEDESVFSVCAFEDCGHVVVASGGILVGVALHLQLMQSHVVGGGN